jgi:drug/metabolite transporter (DMT)-like permease
MAKPAHKHPQLAAAALMTGATFLFALMGVCVKLSASTYNAAEVAFYRGAIGVVLIGLWVALRGGSLRTPVPWMHVSRSASGVLSLMLWFYALAGLPLATAMTLNYMSSVWMALFLIGSAMLLGAARLDRRLVAAVLTGFVGVALVLRPTLEPQQLWHALAGLASGMLAAMAYLQVTALGRAGEPGLRVVFYFSLGGALLGGAGMLATGLSAHNAQGLALLLAIGVTATLAQLLMTRAYAVGHPLTNAALQYLGIVFGFGFGVALFDERVSAWALVGVSLIVGAGMTATLLRGAAGPRNPTVPTQVGAL